jgi:predicted rRNA pseudouridine synthase
LFVGFLDAPRFKTAKLRPNSKELGFKSMDIKKEKSILELINFGIVNIDKPAGCTSFDVVNHIRKILGLEKCGHFGTLDPNVTGVLPICLSKACKLQEYFMHHDKTYIGVMKLHKEITKKQLEAEMKKFIGKINQLPPRKSRVKRQLREREIMQFKITKFDAKLKEAEFISEVEAGTYIRKLISDLGEPIGGAQMISLRRTRAGLFSDKDKEFTTIQNFEEAVKEYKEGKEEKLRDLIFPAEIICRLMPRLEIDAKWLSKLKNGSPIFDEMLNNLEKDKKIIDTKEPFLIFVDNKLIEIAKFTDRFEQKSILAKAEVVLN